MSTAYACKVTEENIPAIKSEKPDFDLDELQYWLAHVEESYFIRDESAPWDCHYMESRAFHRAYLFESFDHNTVFQRIFRID